MSPPRHGPGSRRTARPHQGHRQGPASVIIISQNRKPAEAVPEIDRGAAISGQRPSVAPSSWAPWLNSLDRRDIGDRIDHLPGHDRPAAARALGAVRIPGHVVADQEGHRPRPRAALRSRRGQVVHPGPRPRWLLENRRHWARPSVLTVSGNGIGDAPGGLPLLGGRSRPAKSSSRRS